MDAASQHGTRARPPMLLSWAACLGVLIIVLLSIRVGFLYWWPRDQSLAILTAGAEIIACFGLAVSFAQFKAAWWRGGVGILITLIAAAWCALTMFQKIDTDARAEAVALAQEAPAYVFAKSAADTASSLLQERLRRPEERPACNCPQTVAAWEAAEAAAINRLRAERDSAVEQMQAVIPPPQLNWIAIARGIGVELTKLLGFTAFWLAVPISQSKQPTRRPYEVVEGGLVNDRKPASGEPQTGRRLNLVPLFAGLFGWSVVSSQQMPSTTFSTEAVTDPAERMVIPMNARDLTAAANQLAATGMGERKIAATLSTRTGRMVTRHQVRVMLGREDRAAA